MTSKLLLLPPAQGLKKAVILDKKASGVQGSSLTAGAWRTRDLTTIEGDNTIVSLSNNQFTLSGGSYLIYSVAGTRATESHQTRLYNITDSTVTVEGSTGRSSTSNASGLKSHIKIKIDISSAKTFELQHIVQITGTSGTAAGPSPIYAQIVVLKL